MRIKNFEKGVTLAPQLLSTPSKMLYDEINIERNITYGIILKEIKDLGYTNFIYELEYRLMEDENINEILLSIIHRDCETKSTIGYHYSVLYHYLGQDLLNLFI